MQKRYVFCRKPNGQAHRAMDGKFFPAELLAMIGNNSFLSPEGLPSWRGLGISRFDVILESAFIVLGPDNQELNPTDSARLLWDSLLIILERKPGKPIGCAELLTEADKAAAQFFRKTPTRYVLVTSLSIRDLPVRAITVRGHRITSLKKRTARYKLPSVVRSRAHSEHFSKHLTTTKYRHIAVTGHARSEFEAVNSLLESVHLLRGLWSLFAATGSWSLSGSPKRKRLGAIHTGPVHTLHKADGTPARDDIYWFDADYIDEQPLFRTDKWPELEVHRRRAMRQLARLPHRLDVEGLLIRYAMALDQASPDIAMLKLWGILEKLTNTVGANYDETIRRVLWTYTDESRPMAKDILEAMRSRRNQYVHSGNSAHETNQVGFWIKEFVDPHLMRLLANPLKVRSLEEYAEYLALPSGAHDLRERKRMYSRALQFVTTDAEEIEESPQQNR